MINFREEEIRKIVEIAKEAGILLMKYQHLDDFDSSFKLDNSIVTKADIEANNLIKLQLNLLFPDIKIVSEENSDEENFEAIKDDVYFIVDPLDGTSGYVKKSDEYTVNIALIENNETVFGVICVPQKSLLYFTGADKKSYKIENFASFDEAREIKVAKKTDDLTVISTKREAEKAEIMKYIKEKKVAVKDFLFVNSSYKFCLVAQGSVDLYLRMVSIKSWDVAAGHAILKGAGGFMVNLETGEEIKYFAKNGFDVAFFKVF